MKKQLLCSMLAAVTACTCIGFPAAASSEEKRFSNTISQKENHDILVAFSDLSVTLPADWGGRCLMEISDTEAAFFQKASRQLYTEEYGSPSGGWLFSICFSEDESYKQYPNYEPLARVEDGYYFLSYPTDVQGYLENETAMEEYGEMFREVEWAADSIEFTCEDAVWITYDSEYIFPNSSYEYLTRDDLKGMTADEAQMAINEIYARYGRKFILPEVQEYFDTKSWYYGFIEADEFDTSIFTDEEWANIMLLSEYMKTAPK